MEANFMEAKNILGGNTEGHLRPNLSQIERLKQFARQSASMLNLDRLDRELDQKLDREIASETGMSQPTKAAVIVIGGGEDKVQDRKILRAFVESSGGTSARIGIIPSASREPDIIGRIYSDIFRDLGAEFVDVFDIRDRRDRYQDDPGRLLDDFTGVFMTGGDQLRLCAIIGDTPFALAMRERVHQKRLVLAGTSAGAAAMGHHMISGGSSGETPHKEIVNMATGLGILPEIIVDQHFHNRNRMCRLMTAISSHPEMLGVGIDEDTAAVFEHDNLIKVVGRGAVTIIDPVEMSYSNQLWVSNTAPLTVHNLRIHILAAGAEYNLIKRVPISPSV
ncbi:cyanophycinase [Thalassoporum mexicanum]|uniref:cyanophycinase n=1 Tax=Thalassoporum mexicanum TaxID=3457544 RepID=UPI00030A98CC|nr:cyanophycinase [Pseudanabaena sp. PCC 7367]